MPRIGIRLLLTCLLTTSDLVADCGFAIAACPFCPPSSPPFAEQLAESDVAALVKWVKSIPATDLDSETQTELAVVEVLRKSDGTLKVGDSIRVPYLLEAQPGDLFVMMGKRTEGITDWALPIPVTEISYAYIKQAPSPEQPTTDRLTYFLKFLEFSDTTIANDAFAEFSRARYEDVVAIRDRLSRKTIRQWIADLKPEEQMRLGFYGMLLSLCGNKEDEEFLAREIMPPTPKDQVRLGLDGMMAGYVILAGKPGLDRLVQKKLQTPEQPDGDIYALVNALRFLWQYAPERAPREDVESAMAGLLDRPAFAEVAIVDLARWGHWQITDRVLAMYGQPPFDDPSAKRTIIQFALACVKADERDAETTIAEAATARGFLARLQETDPEALKNAKLFFGGR